MQPPPNAAGGSGPGVGIRQDRNTTVLEYDLVYMLVTASAAPVVAVVKSLGVAVIATLV